MRVKICGITNLEDALNAIDSGADALGFVFYPHSARYITPKKARSIISSLPPFVQFVGLFVKQSADFINTTCIDSGIHIAQLHWDIEDDILKDIKVPFMRVVRAKQKEDILRANGYCLVDSFVESFGGAGKNINLDWFDGVDCSKFILAGGLNDSNIEMIKKYRFYGVDVSSGVEMCHGKKDHEKVKKFIILAKS